MERSLLFALPSALRFPGGGGGRTRTRDLSPLRIRGSPFPPLPELAPVFFSSRHRRPDQDPDRDERLPSREEEGEAHLRDKNGEEEVARACVRVRVRVRASDDLLHVRAPRPAHQSGYRAESHRCTTQEGRRRS